MTGRRKPHNRHSERSEALCAIAPFSRDESCPENWPTYPSLNLVIPTSPQTQQIVIPTLRLRSCAVGGGGICCCFLLALFIDRRASF
jgi:hypothetical protein